MIGLYVDVGLSQKIVEATEFRRFCRLIDSAEIVPLGSKSFRYMLV